LNLFVESLLFVTV